MRFASRPPSKWNNLSIPISCILPNGAPPLSISRHDVLSLSFASLKLVTEHSYVLKNYNP